MFLHIQAVGRSPVRLAGALVVLLAAAVAGAGRVIISEYLEGSGNNKALEIYNGEQRTLDLTAGGYVVQIYYNGSTSPGDTIALTGSLAAGTAWVVCHSSAVEAIQARANLRTPSLKFNGNDAVVLRRGGTNGPVVDSLGRVGENPGTYWGTATNKTADMTLRRKFWVVCGDTKPDDPFNPAWEWDAFPCDHAEGLGSHSMRAESGGFLLRLSRRSRTVGPRFTTGAFLFPTLNLVCLAE